ncbi:MAG: hypothetical protein ACOH2N_04730 [Devosia sp.]
MIEVLRGWKYSPFQFEAPCRHGLRQAMCLAGHQWANSEFVAESIVAEALRSINAHRPSWREGQRDIVDAVECCVQCGAGLDDAQMAHGDRFCSGECAKARLTAMNGAWSKQTTATALAAQKIVAIAAKPKRSCDVCGDIFRPRGHGADDARYCSPKCRGEASRIHGERECECCKKVFMPSHTNGQRFCSIGCKEQARKDSPASYSKCCRVCEKPFMARTASAEFCSKSCRNQASVYRNADVLKATPKVFDHFFTMPINATRPAWITPERFDQMVAA